MTDYLLPMVTLGAVALMYFACIRPMLHRDGSCHTMSDDRGAGLDQEIVRLREELNELRREAARRRTDVDH